MQRIDRKKKKTFTTDEGTVIDTDTKIKHQRRASSPSFLSGLPPRYHKIVTRCIFGAIFLATLYLTKQTGIIGIILFITLIKIQCYREVISIGYKQYKELSLPFFRFFQWYFLFAATFYSSGDIFMMLISAYLKQKWFQTFFTQYQRILSFGLYIIGIILFVLTLKKRTIKVQFSSFSWYHMSLLILTIPSHLLLRSLFFGQVWFFLPMLLIIINDIFAYFFGIAFGRTPLIKISPKKTWEGFIGGGISTLIGAILITRSLAQYPTLYCPVEFKPDELQFVTNCETAAIYKNQSMMIPSYIRFVLSKLGSESTHLTIYPMYFHVIVMSLFASIISPFGGFFASGFKRAFKVKDFGDSIPGHGGMMDRMDCQLLMCVFVNLYINAFIRVPSTQYFVKEFMGLSGQQQREVFTAIKYLMNESIPIL